jgi:hypothetical protein
MSLHHRISERPLPRPDGGAANGLDSKALPGDFVDKTEDGRSRFVFQPPILNHRATKAEMLQRKQVLRSIVRKDRLASIREDYNDAGIEFLIRKYVPKREIARVARIIDQEVKAVGLIMKAQFARHRH